jgi:RNA polymerase sigma-70 factor (ECF subfamily)
MTGWRGLADEVVDARYSSLVAYGVLLTASRADAEDLVQDALVKVFSRIRALPNAAAADQYVRRAMLTLYLDRTRRVTAWRRLRGTVATDDAVAGPEDAVAAGTDVRAALAALTPRERTCVVLRHFDDLSTRQVAEATGLAEGTVKRYLSDGLAKLGAELAPHAETADVVVLPRARRA